MTDDLLFYTMQWAFFEAHYDDATQALRNAIISDALLKMDGLTDDHISRFNDLTNMQLIDTA